MIINAIQWQFNAWFQNKMLPAKATLIIHCQNVMNPWGLRFKRISSLNRRHHYGEFGISTGKESSDKEGADITLFSYGPTYTLSQLPGEPAGLVLGSPDWASYSLLSIWYQSRSQQKRSSQNKVDYLVIDEDVEYVAFWPTVNHRKAYHKPYRPRKPRLQHARTASWRTHSDVRIIFQTTTKIFWKHVMTWMQDPQALFNLQPW
jgi:hypothetical protein